MYRHLGKIASQMARSSLALGTSKASVGSRFCSTKARVEHIKRMQEHFQRPSDLPVFLKGGPLDKILFYVTLLLIAGAAANFVYTFGGMAFPSKKK